MIKVLCAFCVLGKYNCLYCKVTFCAQYFKRIYLIELINHFPH